MADELDKSIAESIEKVVDERGQTGSLAQKIKIWLLQISNGNQSQDDNNKQFEVIQESIKIKD